MGENIYVTRPSIPPLEEYIEELRDIWDSCHLTNNGPKHEKLKSELRAFLESENVELFTNGHLALENLIGAFDLKGKVITTPFTFVSTTNAIIRNGLTPVFCDIKADDYTIDPKEVEKLITPDVSAIVAVHVYGNVCDDEALSEIASRYGIKVIYDAAHAFGIRAGGKSVSSLGDASMYSFHATKAFNTIEGGAAVFKDASLSSKLAAMKNFGMKSAEEFEYAAGNAKMSEFQAAMGLCNLRHFEEEIEKRRIAAERYRTNLSGINGIKLCEEREDVKSNYAYMPVLFDGYKMTRDEVQAKLGEHGIYSRKYFYPLTSEGAYTGSDPHDTPTALHISKNILCLPIYAGLKTEDVDMICEIICDR